MTNFCYASVDGILGPAQVGDDLDLIELVNFQYDITMPADLGDGTITGRRQHGYFAITHEIGDHSLGFARAICENLNIPKVVVSQYRTDPDSGEVIRVFSHEIRQVSVVAIHHQREDGDDLETVKLMFDEITFRDSQDHSFSDSWNMPA